MPGPERKHHIAGPHEPSYTPAVREPELRTGRLNRRIVRLFYLLSPLLFGAISLAVFKARGTSFADAFRAPAAPLQQAPFALLAGMTLGLVIGLVVARSNRLSSLREIIRQVFAAANPTALDLILTSVSAGFSEELLFRGVLQGEALRLTTRDGPTLRLGPLSLANVLVTLAFVALHMRAQPLAWALAVAVPSLVFGHLRERFASVWPAVLVHVVYNAGFGLAAWLANR